MSDFVWTEEQQRVIDSRDKNILVSAGAGSGKTAVLTERLKHLVLEEREDCSKMLVLTFTRAAAAEMKQRFIKKLYEALEEEEWDLSEREILSQIDALNDAQISTIDSFAATMARRYFQVAGVDPSFHIANESQLKLMQEETFDEVFEELFTEAEKEGENGFTKLIDIYGGSRSNDDLKDVLRSLINFMESLPYPDKWLEEVYRQISQTDEDSFFDLPVFKALYTSLEEFKKRVKRGYQELEFLSEEMPWNKKSKSYGNLNAEISMAERIGESENLPDLLINLNNFESGRITLPKKTKTNIKSQFQEIRGDSKKKLIKEIKGLQKKFAFFRKELEYKRTQEMNEHFKSLLDLVSLINKRMEEKKARAQILSFSDVERALLRILSDPKSRLEIQNEYQYIFLDEFQDTNDLQEEIISLIESGTNRSMFGDIKQSIVRPYRGRYYDCGIVQ